MKCTKYEAPQHTARRSMYTDLYLFYLTTVMQRSICVGRQRWYRIRNKNGMGLDKCFGTTIVSQDKERRRASVNPVMKIQVP